MKPTVQSRIEPTIGSDAMQDPALTRDNVITVHRTDRPAAPDMAHGDLEMLDRMLRLLDETIELAELTDHPAARYHFDCFALEALHIFKDVLFSRAGGASEL